MTIPRINPHQLLVFYFVAKEESFTAASEKLCLTEPAVSKQMKALEESVGVKLVYVKKKRVHLTDAGQVLLRYAEEIYQQLRSADIFLEETRERSLRVGVSPTFSSIVTSAAVQFGNLFPNTNLNIKSSSSHEVVRQLLDRQYDIAVVVSVNYHTDRLRAVRLSDGEKLLLVIRRSTPIEASDALTLADLRDYKLIIPRAGSATREVLLNRFQAEGLEVINFIEMETDYLQYDKLLGEIEKGIAFVPEADARRGVSEGRLRILHLANDICVAADALFLKDSPRHKLAEKFTELVKQAFEASHTSTTTSAGR
ncbi:MAG: LysR family transcriptional regulator [Dehalococcoidia bacterium]|nr:LysR family transcriptional regulator [Dehalococcoidia bacterium]